MLEPPTIPESAITECLRASYELTDPAIAFLPLGYDASAWVYHVAADDGQRYFLKLRRGTAHTASIAVARFLQERGIEQVVAPIPTTAGHLTATLDDYTLLLFPWIEGRTGAQAEGGLSDDQWIAYGVLVRRIHEMRLPADLAGVIPREEFVLKHGWSAKVRQLTAMMRQEYDHPYERQFTTLWRRHDVEIMRVVRQAERLGSLLRHRPRDFVLCHGDLHTSNLLVTPDGRLHVVDWDQPILAPRERDLMFVVGDDLTANRHETLFLVGYGATEVDALALAYYRFEWCVQEFVDFGERVFLLADIGDETKADSAQGFAALFESGDVVESAHRAARMAWLE